ncbi:MAG: calcium/sodium antiporter [Candidatus Puniceispirillales bacterium]
MLFSLFLVLAGLVTLYCGGEALVRGSVLIAQRFHLPKLIIGLLIVGFGTSMPEMLVSVQAVLGGTPEIALGNVVGSNIANVLLIIGTALVLMPIREWDTHARRGALFATAVAVLLYLFCMTGFLGRIQALLLLLALAGYLGFNYVMISRNPQLAEAEEIDHDALDAMLERHKGLAWLAAIAGILLLMAGADMLIAGAVTIARAFGVSDAVIGLSLVAFGTSLPELVAAIVAAVKREAEVILGGVIGSNIFNVLAILGVAVMIKPMAVTPRITAVDVPLVIATSLGLWLMLILMKQMNRGLGIIMLGLYIGYIAMLVTQVGS